MLDLSRKIGLERKDFRSRIRLELLRFLVNLHGPWPLIGCNLLGKLEKDVQRDGFVLWYLVRSCEHKLHCACDIL